MWRKKKDENSRSGIFVTQNSACVIINHKKQMQKTKQTNKQNIWIYLKCKEWA